MSAHFHNGAAKSFVRIRHFGLFLAVMAVAVSGCGSADSTSRVQSGQAVIVYVQKPHVGKDRPTVTAIDVDGTKKDALIAVEVGTTGMVVADDAQKDGVDRWVTVSVSKLDLWMSAPLSTRDNAVSKDLSRGVMTRMKIQRRHLRPHTVQPGAPKSELESEDEPVDFSKYVNE